MKILATATPNKKYRHYANLKNTLIQARIVGGQVRFYEMHDGKEKRCLTHERVKSLFLNGRLINRKPFLEKENKQFISILYKNRKLNHSLVSQLINH